jgi:hypothetical protein
MKQEVVPGSGADVARVLLVVQASLWLLAGLSGILVGIFEHPLAPMGAASVLLAAATFWLARAIGRRRRWPRRVTLALEVACILGSMLLVVLPLGAMRGPLPILTNLLLPGVILVLLVRHRHEFPHRESKRASWFRGTFRALRAPASGDASLASDLAN